MSRERRQNTSRSRDSRRGSRSLDPGNGRRSAPKTASFKLVAFTKSPTLAAMALAALPPGWEFRRCERVETYRGLLLESGVRVVIVDDEAVAERDRGWLLDQTCRFVPSALLIYVAGVHSRTAELRARSFGVDYYTAKPLDLDRTRRVLEAFLRLLADGDAYNTQRVRSQ
jgi:hypothetical protein